MRLKTCLSTTRCGQHCSLQAASPFSKLSARLDAQASMFLLCPQGIVDLGVIGQVRCASELCVYVSESQGPCACSACMCPPTCIHACCPSCTQVAYVKVLNLAFNNLASLQALSALTTLQVCGGGGRTNKSIPTAPCTQVGPLQQSRACTHAASCGIARPHGRPAPPCVAQACRVHAPP